MIRGFVTGVLWGGLVAVAGLAVVSQVAPPPEIVARPISVTDGSGPEPEVEPASDAADAAAPLAPEPVVEPLAEPVAAAAENELPAAADVARPATPLLDPPEVLQASLSEPLPTVPDTETAQAATAGTLRPSAPGAEPAPGALREPNPVPAAGGGDGLLVPAPAVAPDPAPLAPLPDGTARAADLLPLPAPPAAESIPVADGTVAPPAKPVEPAPIQPAPIQPAPIQPTPIEAPPRVLKDDTPDTLPSVGTIGNRAGGVTTGRLPSIGGAAAPVVAAEAADPSPLHRYARVFAGAGGKPLFVILLRDIGPAGMARDSLTTLPFPVTFVIDPAAPDAAAAAAAYRAAGQEVLMLATGIPPGAQPSDLEQTFQSLAATLPEAVGVVDLAEGGFQDNRDLAAQVVPILKEQGRGLVTYDQGLNAADQVARREGVAATTIFRRLDGAGEAVPVVRRSLDRAAFRAAQEGQVVVIGDTLPATVAAILEWAVEGRAASVTLAPVTAVLAGE